MLIKFTVYGTAIPQGRPRAYRRGNYIGFYDPKESKDWKEMVRWQAIQRRRNGLLNTPIKLSADFYLPRPKSLPKKVCHHTKKPDLDNLVKGVKDALRGIIYRDDSQIVSIEATKDYGDPPRVEISIQEVL